MLDETTYYFTAFALDQNNNIIDSETSSITTDFGWHVTPNTLAYFPFKDDLNDHSGNGISLSNTQYLTKQTLGYKWQFSQGNTGLGINVQFENSGGNARFLSVWFKINSASGNSNGLCFNRFGVNYNPAHGNANLANKITVFTTQNWSIGAQSSGPSFGSWHHLTIGYDGSKILISKDGVQTTLYNGTGYNFSNIISIIGGGNNTNMTAFISEFICEDRCWSQEEITKYYNKTKSMFGL